MSKTEKIDRFLSTDRKDFEKGVLSLKGSPNEPFSLFREWLEKAIEIEETEAYTVLLSTSRNNVPDSRVLFLRGFKDEKFIFYTNYLSVKGKDMQENGNVALNFYWSKLERQVRIRGTVQKCNKEQSDSYFAGRPRESQIGAWASKQSQQLESRDELVSIVKEIEQRFKGKDVPRPDHWGGYEVSADQIEFWQGGKNRLHDRVLYSKTGDEWEKQRCFP